MRKSRAISEIVLNVYDLHESNESWYPLGLGK